MIGVIGGMGPLATADFVRKVVMYTVAEHDHEHVPLLISNDPRIASRPAAILAGGESPLPRLIDIRDRLIAAGATALVMPCNTAHYWHGALTRDCALPFPSIIDVTCDAAVAQTGDGDSVALIATDATLASGLFQAGLERSHRKVILPSQEIVSRYMLPSIASVKSGKIEQSAQLMKVTIEHLLGQGASKVILACTEAPIAVAGLSGAFDHHCIDSTEALARATIRLWEQIRVPV